MRALLAAALLLGLAACSSDGVACRTDTDCNAGEEALGCDVGESPPGVCRRTCSSLSQLCQPFMSAPYPEGDSDACPSTQRCECNPVRATFYCRPR